MFVKETPGLVPSDAGDPTVDPVGPVEPSNAFDDGNPAALEDFFRLRLVCA